MLCTILYFENSYKARFVDLNKCVKNYYVFNKTEYPGIVTAVQRLLLNFQPYYNSNRQSQYRGVSNQLLFAHHSKTGVDYDETKGYKQNPK